MKGTCSSGDYACSLAQVRGGNLFKSGKLQGELKLGRGRKGERLGKKYARKPKKKSRRMVQKRKEKGDSAGRYQIRNSHMNARSRGGGQTPHPGTTTKKTF